MTAAPDTGSGASPHEQHDWVEVPAETEGGIYRWLTACVVPRPIAWVSSLSAGGVRNLAPHSFFTVASHDPPVLAFVSIGLKDTLRNVRETGEFVVCLAGAALAAQVNRTSAPYPPEVDELAAADLATAPSVTVRPERLALSPVAFECVAAGEHAFRDDDKASVMVFGRVQHIAVHADVLAGDGLPDPTLLAPVARLGRDQWAHLGEVFVQKRPRRPD